MNELYFIPIKETTDSLTLNKLYLLVSNEKQKQINCLHFDIDKKLGIYS
jgi:hypothetical protein